MSTVPVRRRRAVAAAAALLVAVAPAACTAQEPEPTPVQVTVAGDVDGVPSLEYVRPLDPAEASTEVILEGTGPVLRADKPVLIRYLAESTIDGSVVIENYSTVPESFVLAPENLGAALYEALRGQRVGSRVLHVAPAQTEDDSPLAIVIDILPTRATGEPVPSRDGLPTVELSDDGEPTVTVPEDTEPPTELVAQPLIRGTGAQVQYGQLVTVQYVGVNWSDGSELGNSWTGAGPFTAYIGVGDLLGGWDLGLVEQTVGSQVLLVVPPEFGYPDGDTAVFVVDILDVSGEPDETGGAG